MTTYLNRAYTGLSERDARLCEALAKNIYDEHEFVRPWEKTPDHIRASHRRSARCAYNFFKIYPVTK
jgi:hypothetical protein